MELWEKIYNAYPEIPLLDTLKNYGILLQDDGDGIHYIAKWEYEKPIPEGLTLGKPGGN